MQHYWLPVVGIPDAVVGVAAVVKPSVVGLVVFGTQGAGCLGLIAVAVRLSVVGGAEVGHTVVMGAPLVKK